MSPKVSVVLVFYNGDNFIREAVASVEAQEFADWELVLTDDGSVDASAEFAREAAAGSSRIRYVTHPDRRIAASREIGRAAGQSIGPGSGVRLSDKSDAQTNG